MPAAAAARQRDGLGAGGRGVCVGDASWQGIFLQRYITGGLAPRRRRWRRRRRERERGRASERDRWLGHAVARQATRKRMNCIR